MIKLYNGDCLEVMDKLIADGVKVDAIITDPPYQTTACDWDTLIPFNNYLMLPKSSRSKKLYPVYKDEYILQELKKGREYNEIVEYFDANAKEGMWQKLDKLIKPNGAIVLFGSEPFSSALRMSNIKNYKYDWIWYKNNPTGIALAGKQPMRSYENISIFNKHKFYAQKMKSRISDRKTGKSNGKFSSKKSSHYGFQPKKEDNILKTMVNPWNVLEFKVVSRAKGTLHPTQKPVALMEYLIKTYTNENELVLDFTMGSGSTGVACKNLNRNFIGIELDEKYYNIAKKRIETN